jgi:hypothetical protein
MSGGKLSSNGFVITNELKFYREVEVIWEVITTTSIHKTSLAANTVQA